MTRDASPGKHARAVSALAFGLPAILVVIAYEYRNVGGLLLALTLLFAGLAWRATLLRASFTFLAALFLAITAAEAVAPWLYTPPANRNTLEGPLDYWVMTDIGAIASEGKHSFKLTGPGGRQIYDVIYTIGEDGFRETPSNPENDDRINFFGDSFTFGEGLNDDETLPFFTAQLTGRHVKNFGFHGYGIQQPLAIMESELHTGGPVNFLLTIPWHAQRTACKVTYSAGSPQYEVDEDGEVIQTGMCRQITDLGPLGKILSRSRLYDLYLATRSTDVTDDDYARYLALIEEMAQLSHERYQKFIVGFIRADESLFKGTHYSNDIILEKLRQIADEVVDLTLAPRNEDLARDYYIDEVDKHPAALANKARAQLLKEALDRASK